MQRSREKERPGKVATIEMEAAKAKVKKAVDNEKSKAEVTRKALDAALAHAANPLASQTFPPPPRLQCGVSVR
jgi:hypothetical protein